MELLPLHDLLVLCQGADRAALEELYRRFSGEVLRRIHRSLRGSEADDVHQEVWLVLFVRPARIDPARWATFPTWLRTIADNKVKDWFRAKGRDRLINQPEALPETAAPEVEEEDIRLSRLREVVAGLPEEDREFLRLRWEEDLTLAQMGVRLGFSTTTAHTREQRIFAEIAEQLRNRYGEDAD